MDRSALSAWVFAGIPPEATAWLAEAIARTEAGGLAELGPAISRAGRKIPRTPLAPPAAGWPGHWTADQAARVLLAAHLPATDAVRWLADLDQVFACAEVGESVALYQGLACLPRPHLLAPRAAVGVRSSIEAVWAAVALDNPFPAAHLDPGAFNQMVLKGLFLTADVRRIHGLAARADADLGRMLRDYARERNAAKRPLPPHFDFVLALCPL